MDDFRDPASLVLDGNSTFWDLFGVLELASLRAELDDIFGVELDVNLGVELDDTLCVELDDTFGAVFAAFESLLDE